MGYRTIAYGDKGTLGYATSGTVVEVPYPAGIATGQMLVCQVLQATATDDIQTPDGWTKLGSDSEGSGTTGANSAWFAKVAAGTESGNLSVSRTGDVAVYFYGIMWRTDATVYASAASIEKAGPVSGTSTSASSSSITPSVDGCYVAVLLNLEDNTSIAQFTGGNYVERFDVNTNQGDDAGFAMDGYAQTTAANEPARTSTIGGTDCWMTLTIAILPATTHVGAGTIAAQATLTGNAKANRFIRPGVGALTIVGKATTVTVPGVPTNVDVGYATGKNIWSNADLESGIDDWNDHNSGLVSSSSSQAWHGTKSLEINPDAAQYAGGKSDVKSIVTESTQYTLSYYIYPLNGSMNIKCIVQDQGGTWLANNTAATTQDTWTRRTLTFSTGVGDTGMAIFFEKNDASGSGHFFIDGIQVQLGASATAWEAYGANSNLAITGKTTNVSKDTKVLCGSKGSIAVLGYNPIVTVSSVTQVSCTKGVLTVAGFKPLLSEELVIPVNGGAVTIAGLNTLLGEETSVLADTGSVAIAGYSTLLSEENIIPSSKGAVSVVGYNTKVFYTTAIDCSSTGAVAIAGNNVTFNVPLLVSCGSTGSVSVAAVATAGGYATVAEVLYKDELYNGKIGSNTTTDYKRASEIQSMPETCAVTRIKVWLARQGSPSGNIWFEIWNDSGGTPGSLITGATSNTVDVTTIETTGNGGEEVTFDFSSPPTLSSGTNYYFVTGFDYAVNASNHIRWWGHSSQIAGWSLWQIYQDATENELPTNCDYTIIQKTSADRYTTINLQTNISCSKGSAAVVGYTADIQLGGPVTVSCTKGAVAIAGYAAGVGGITYYIRADGTAATKEDATSDAAAATSMSIATHNSETFAPGDTIVISDAGGIYRGHTRGQLQPPSNGSSGLPITYSASGSPVFDGGDAITGWTNYSGNIWQATATNPRSYDAGGNILLDDVWGTYQSGGTGSLTAEGDWYWASNVLYLYAPGDPDSQYGEVTVPYQHAMIRLLDDKFLTFDGIEVRHCISHGIYLEPSTSGQMDGIIFRNIRSHHNDQTGFFGNGTTGNEYINLLVEDSRFDHNGYSGAGFGSYFYNAIFRRIEADHNGLDITVDYVAGLRAVCAPDNGWVSYGWLVEHCKCYSNGKDDSETEVNDAAGIWIDTLGDNSNANPCIVRYNATYDNTGEGLYCENNDGSLWYGNISYGNVGTANDGKGLWCSCSVTAYPSQNNVFYNNTLYGNEIGYQNSGNWGVTGTETAINNIFRNNIVSGNTTYELKVLAGAENVHGANGWGSGNVYTNNCFGAEANNFINWALSDYDTYDAWEAVYEASSSIEADPAFKDAANDKFYLTSGSPCIDAGVNLGATYDDALDPRILAAAWPDAVVTLDQDLWGAGWEVGAYVYDGLTATGAVAVAKFNTVVTLTSNIIVSCTKGALTVAGLNPIVTVFEGVTVDCTMGAVAVLGRPPTVETERGILVKATGAVTVTAFDAVITLPETVLVTSGAVTVAARQPNVVVGVKTLVTCSSKGAITLSGFKPEIALETAALASVGSLIVERKNTFVWAPTGVHAARGAVSVAGRTANVSITQEAIPATLGAVTVAAVSPAFAMPDWYPKRIDAQSKQVTILGKAASIIAPIIATTLGTVAVTGYTAEIHQAKIDVFATKGSVSVAGYETIIGTKVNVATKGAVTVTGYDAAGTISAIAYPGVGKIDVYGHATVVNALPVWATQGDVVVLGHNPFVVAPFTAGEAVSPTQTSKNYITYYQDWATHFPAEVARRWRQFLLDTFFIATPATIAGGTGNSIELTTDAEITEHTIGQAWRFIASATNTGGTILDVNGIGPQTVHYNDQPLKGGEIVAGGSYEVVFDGNAWNLTSSSRNVVGSSGRVHMVSQVVGHASAEPLVWSDRADYDDSGYFYPVGSAIEYILIPQNGRYRINGNVYVSTKDYGAGTLTRVIAAIYINEWSCGSIVNSSNTYECDVPFDYTAALVAGDVITIELYQQNSGSSSAAIVGDSAVPISPTWWSIERLR